MAETTDARTYIRDNSNSDVSGIVVVETSDEQGFRVTENRDLGWSAPFWMPRGEFSAVTHSDDVELVGVLNNDKFERVLDAAEPVDA